MKLTLCKISVFIFFSISSFLAAANSDALKLEDTFNKRNITSHNDVIICSSIASYNVPKGMGTPSEEARRDEEEKEKCKLERALKERPDTTEIIL